MVKITIEDTKCFGCSVCMYICPKNCITMQINEYGERKPKINIDACVGCKLCQDNCPALILPTLRKPQETYAMTYRDSYDNTKSASGGAAKALYEKAISENYMVYGCGFDSNYILNIKKASNCDEIKAFSNSKYSFSRMDGTYLEIKSLLDNGRKVLFIGLSCQVHALLCFLGKNYEKLITVDLICHGVPPESYFREYIKDINNKYNIPIDEILFRGNTKEHDFYLSLFSDSKCVVNTFAREDLFYAGYVNCIMFEEKCYSCPFATINRSSDITIGDWGGETKIYNKKLSLVFANSDKGVRFINKLQNDDRIIWEEHTVNEALISNEQLNGPSTKPDYYHELRKYYKENGYMIMADKYIKPLIVAYRKRIRNEKIKRLLYLPLRVIRKIKRMVLK